MTKNAHTPPAPLSAVERQRRYRIGRLLVSIDISGTNSTLIQDLRSRTGLTTDQVLGRALELLRADLGHSSRPATRRSPRPAVDDQQSLDLFAATAG